MIILLAEGNVLILPQIKVAAWPNMLLPHRWFLPLATNREELNQVIRIATNWPELS